MNKLFFLFALINSKKIKFIKNVDYPSCKNCIYYKPSLSSLDFDSTLSKCEKFGKKNIISEEITYDYVESCRDDKEKCGIEGKYFEEESNIRLKIIKHQIISKGPYLGFILFYITYIILSLNK